MDTIRNSFTGITAVPQETDSGQASWPSSSSNYHYAANLVKIRALLSMPEVDSSRVYLMGFSNGGFYSYLLACTIGNELAGIVVLAGLKDVQPTCPHRTNVLHLHNANDNMNPPQDASAGSKGGSALVGAPASLRTNWLASGSGSSGSSETGATQGAFTLYSATSSDGKSFLYWSYNGPSEHTFTVYPDSAANRPDSPFTQDQYTVAFLTALSITSVSPSPSTPPGIVVSPSPSTPPGIVVSPSPSTPPGIVVSPSPSTPPGIVVSPSPSTPPGIVVSPSPSTPPGIVEQTSPPPAAGGASSQAKPPPPDTGSSSPCFPAAAAVTRANGERTTLGELRAGDAIIAANADGSLTTDTVSVFSIADSDVSASFLAITTDGGATLTLTAAHHVPHGPTCCAQLRTASEVRVNDTLWVLPHGGASLAARTVVRVDKVESAHGLFSPVLKHGAFPVVDEVVTSFDAADRVALVQRALPAAETLCSLTGTCIFLRHALLSAHRRYVDDEHL